MLSWLAMLLGFSAAAPIPEVAVRAAYRIHAPASQEEEPTQCCGLCTKGVIKHGDGHTTPCPCPDSCECKR